MNIPLFLPSSSSTRLHFHDSRQLWFPLVSIVNELLLVVEQLLVPESGVLKVGSFDNGIDGAGFLAESAEDALSHVDIILGSPSRAIGARLTFNLDCKGRAGGLAQLASNASLFTSGVATERMLTTEHGGEWSLLPRVVDDVIGLEGTPVSEEHGWPRQLGHEHLGVQVLGHIGCFDLVGKLFTG